MRTLKQILKTITKYRLSSALSLMSLVVAFLGIIVLTLYVSYEKSFDNFHKDGDDIYLMSFKHSMGSALPVPMRDFIKNEIPEIENSAISWYSSNLLFVKPEQSRKDGIDANAMQVSKEFFSMFNFPLLIGDATTVLDKPNNMVISESLANKIFGTTDVEGEQLFVNGNTCTITGVMKDMPNNTSFKNDAYIAFNIEEYEEDWTEWSFSIFFKLRKGTKKEIVSDKMSSTSDERIVELLDALEERHPPEGSRVELIPLKTIHFNSRGFTFAQINERVLDVLMLLIVMLLIMSAVNFINFSTSQAPLRAKSLSIQQILGEQKWKSQGQIMGEAILLSLVAMGISLLLHHLTYQRIENLFQISGLSFIDRESFIPLFVMGATLFGIIAAAYPALYITSAPMAQVVKGKMYFSAKGKGFRSVLITIQFIFTIALVASSLTIEKQLRFWNNFDLGIEKEGVLYLSMNETLQQSHQAFTNELIKNPQITDYCYTQFLPGYVGMVWGRNVDGQQVLLKAWPVDNRFIDFFEIEMAQGRNFSQGESDINNFILNEEAVKTFKWDNPLERKFSSFGTVGDIVGVAKNFNFASLQEGIEPMVLWFTGSASRKDNVLIKTQSTNITQIREFIERTAQKIDSEGTFSVRFLDDELEALYGKETRMARFIEFVALWTILLALTGLLGLVIFISRDRVKEIGIRRVNGASALQILNMLNKSVLIWVGIAFVIATPIAYYAMSRWLENFAYKTTLSWWIFALAGIVSLLVALLTVSWQSWRAATRNPVEALRYE
ncbi:MAG: FtsX-like permease family protein [Bacteroidales bacterium]|jgi:putative ABC transport system permease protein|nr:FtsX-like permease family protein [Bacteroidales bacterium]